MTSGKEGPYKFHRCAVNFHVNHDVMKDIIEVYKDITFEEGHGAYCSSSPDKGAYLSNGNHLVNVKAKLTHTDQMVLDEYKTEHEYYDLSI